ncbi:unnamed protein product [Cladocopium goreaui]|uniref:Uncharacterized protein n=1 Tax=Cladocopium goreaui TaxID=2562237 RepID=A0A9P1DI05_9DINO|nr:unnamed protein product [Cladocopium goreaui]
MANKFLDLAHLRTSGIELRNLDAMAGNLRLKSLEECNKDTINASLFGIHFGHKIEEQERGGVRYALKSKQYLNNEDYALLHNLHPGNAQFFDFGEMPGPTAQSIWDDFGLLWDGLTLVSWQWMLGFPALFQLGLVIASGTQFDKSIAPLNPSSRAQGQVLKNAADSDFCKQSCQPVAAKCGSWAPSKRDE